MKVCPKNIKHNRFFATAHVTENWLVDAEGNFIEVSDSSDCEVTHEPDERDVWTCAECGAEAVRSVPKKAQEHEVSTSAREP